MKLKPYKFDATTITARNYRTAVRRLRGFERGEMDINGKTIRAKDRKPPGSPMRKRGG